MDIRPGDVQGLAFCRLHSKQRLRHEPAGHLCGQVGDFRFSCACFAKDKFSSKQILREFFVI